MNSLNDYASTQLMCAFCENLLPSDAKWCASCNEYKGVMTVEQFEKVYGECVC